MWWAIGIGVIFFFLLTRLEENVKRLWRGRGDGFSQSFNVNTMRAVLQHPKFSELTGIVSAKKSWIVTEWTKADQAKWDKFRISLSSKTYVHVNYLVSEDIFFVRSGNETYMTKKHFNNTVIYSKIVLGDEDGFGPRLELTVYDRLLKKDTIYERVITPCLEYHKEAFGKGDFSVLCDFPYQISDGTDEFYQGKGFEVKRTGGDDVYTNNFGEMEGVPTMIDYTKNGAEISFIYF